MRMYNYVITVFLILISHICLAQTCEVVDDKGHKLFLTHPAKRIISLAPDLTEMMFAIGAGDRLVGVVSGSDYPAAAKNIPVVASFNSIDLEKIVSLHPDLILVWSEGKLAQSLQKMGIPIYISHQQRVADVALTLHHLGCLTGMTRIADQIALDFLSHYHAIQIKYSQRKKINVFYQVWLQPLITVSKDSWIDDAILLCGGKNIFANLMGAAPEVNLEAVVTANPDVIIGAELNNNWKQYWQKWPNMTAVKKDNIFTIKADLIERASPRLLAGVEEMCEAIDIARKSLIVPMKLHVSADKESRYDFNKLMGE